MSGLKADLTVVVDADGVVQRAGHDGRSGDHGRADPATDSPVDRTVLQDGDAEGERLDPAPGAVGPLAAVAGSTSGAAGSGTPAPLPPEPIDPDEDEPVEPAQAYRDRASYTPERYIVVRPLAELAGAANGSGDRGADRVGAAPAKPGPRRGRRCAAVRAAAPVRPDSVNDPMSAGARTS